MEQNQLFLSYRSGTFKALFQCQTFVRINCLSIFSAVLGVRRETVDKNDAAIQTVFLFHTMHSSSSWVPKCNESVKVKH